LPIGRPLDNYQVYIVDARLRPVPVGVVGELVIGGIGLARGYWKRPALTAERFVPNPWWETGDPGPPTLYKTGDLARYRPDGQIEFLGRADNQVKVRGYRIELGEIEAVLQQHPAVSQAVVQAVGERLAGYVVLSTPAENEHLLDHLRQTLPDFMIPAVLVRLDALPALPNGKVDRAALPKPDWTGGHRRYEPPQTRVEEWLAAIFTELLEVAEVGREDNFFEIGGHSLLLIQLIARTTAVFGVELPLKLFFTARPTIANLAEAIVSHQLEQASEAELAAALQALDGVLSEEEMAAFLVGSL
jgi:acyl carrier protein